MNGAAERMPAWRGPTVLSHGFRPFFLGAGIWAAAAMTLWLAMLTGVAAPPTAFDPVSWHAHEFLFGYLGAVVAGFLLTAVPNWTGRPPLIGWPLGGLAALWIAGRAAVLLSDGIPPPVVALADLAFPVALAAAVAHEILAARNWRNLVMLAVLGALTLGNALFHWEAARGDYAAGGLGLRLGIGAGIAMVAVVGGRIVPSFTRNWLAQRGDPARPAPPMQPFDRVAVLALVGAMLIWVVAPDAGATGLALLVAGLLHAARLARWTGHRTGAEPLLLVLHAAYAFVPLGALALGAATLWPGAVDMVAAQHLWTAGAIGLMTLAVMTRATLGHTGHPLVADTGTVAIYLLLAGSVLARVLAAALPVWASVLQALSGMGWIAAFGGFAALYGPRLLGPRVE